MGSVNMVVLIGRLGRDPEMKYSQQGLAICRMSLATETAVKDSSGGYQKKTEWHRLVAFDKTAELCGEHLQKGHQVYFEGRLETNKWTDKDGQERATVQIRVTRMTFLERREGGQQNAPPRAGTPAAARAQGGGHAQSDHQSAAFDYGPPPGSQMMSHFNLSPGPRRPAPVGIPLPYLLFATTSFASGYHCGRIDSPGATLIACAVLAAFTTHTLWCGVRRAIDRSLP